MDLKNKIKSILKKQVRSFTLVSESYVYVSATRNIGHDSKLLCLFCCRNVDILLVVFFTKIVYDIS